jgi:hypothetical protein
VNMVGTSFQFVEVRYERSNHRANSGLIAINTAISAQYHDLRSFLPLHPRCRSSVSCQDTWILATWMRRARCTPPLRRRRGIGASGDFAVHLVESMAGVCRQCDAEVHFSSHESGWQAVGYRNKNSGTDPISVVGWGKLDSHADDCAPCGSFSSNSAKVKSGEHAERTHPPCMRGLGLGQWHPADTGQCNTR